jgi:hypothetical protein
LNLLRGLGSLLEVLGGARPVPATLSARPSLAVVRGLVWVALFLLTWAFSGRATKFIYIDF